MKTVSEIGQEVLTAACRPHNPYEQDLITRLVSAELAQIKYAENKENYILVTREREAEQKALLAEIEYWNKVYDALTITPVGASFMYLLRGTGLTITRSLFSLLLLLPGYDVNFLFLFMAAVREIQREEGASLVGLIEFHARFPKGLPTVDELKKIWEAQIENNEPLLYFPSAWEAVNNEKASEVGSQLLKADVRVLSGDEAILFLSEVMEEMGKLPREKTTEDLKNSFPGRVFAHWLEKRKVSITDELLAFLVFHTKGLPSRLLMWVAILKEIGRQSGKTNLGLAIGLGEFTCAFPMGVPTNEEYDYSWRSQKQCEISGSGNSLDHDESWVD